ncbi:hypothetical protein KM043_004407 [Ampulex compressa]|nr:hypothetical protein KM043_004407 [Ampulex compressa]
MDGSKAHGMDRKMFPWTRGSDMAMLDGIGGEVFSWTTREWMEWEQQTGNYPLRAAVGCTLVDPERRSRRSPEQFRQEGGRET